MVTVTAIVLVIVIVILVRKLHRAKGKVAMDHLYKMFTPFSCRLYKYWLRALQVLRKAL